MTMDTVSLFSRTVSRSACVSSQSVRPSIYRFKVPRVDTSSVTTEVVKLEAIGDFSNKKFVGESISSNMASESSHLSVSMLVEPSHPSPTSIILIPDVGPEEVYSSPFDFRVNFFGLLVLLSSPRSNGAKWVSILAEPTVMGRAKSLSPSWFVAVLALWSVGVLHRALVSCGHKYTLPYAQVQHNGVVENGRLSRAYEVSESGGGDRADSITVCSRSALLAYAKIQHENLDYQHPNGGRAKYLGGPLLERHQELLRHIADRTITERGSDLGDAMIDTADKMADDLVRNNAPIDTGELYRSGSPSVIDKGVETYRRPPEQPRLSEDDPRLGGQ